MSAEVKEHPHITPVRAGKNTAEIGGRAEIVEPFYWRLDEGSAPEKFLVRPYALNQARIQEIDQLAIQADENAAECNALKAERGPMRAAVRMEAIRRGGRSLEPDEDESEAARSLRLLNERIAELEAMPTRRQVVAQHYYIPIIKEWTLTIDGVPVPLTVEGIAQLDPVLLGKLRMDLDDFFFGDKRMKKKG